MSAAAARVARRVESSRRISSEPAWISSGGRRGDVVGEWPGGQHSLEDGTLLGRVPGMSSGPFRGGGGYRLATLPRRFAGHLTADGTLAVTGAPEEIGTLSFSMAWHPRLDGSCTAMAARHHPRGRTDRVTVKALPPGRGLDGAALPTSTGR
jgi:hypothetical protein